MSCPDPSSVMLVVAAALIDGDGRVLVQKRPAGKPMAGLWEFPGGKVEAGETPEVALVRELAEELGVAVDSVDAEPLTFASAPLNDRHLILLLYTIRQWRGEPEARHASALQWASIATLETLSMPPADVPLVAALSRAI